MTTTKTISVTYGWDKLVPFTVVADSGRVAKVDGALQFSSDDPAVATAVLESEGVIRIVTGEVGDALITISADKDLGEGTEYFETYIKVDVMSETAASFSFGDGIDAEKVVAPAEPTA